ncbi:DNA mismatch endonuclease Vsr [Mesorhizobium sp. CA6]|uniref:very short patch repair endonuclease n=1 Tax=Mesorhizobium sp. CA6 TaxID=588500 RepID=UPI001CCD14DE|nr:DNA mismatch endonuclease Vsr [Mesorhizobium sp. CA6]MBZ9770352.1 DNA mismatch endonuclease Vsr [Mesorhizobium sp. CA6]
MDRLSPERRSYLMSRVRSKDTTPEMVVRKLVHRLGYRFRLHSCSLPGKPDLVFPSRKKIIFVHGCFWHRHLGCAKATVPKSHTDFWQEKFDKNVRRDQHLVTELSAQGWEIMVVWQCETNDGDSLRAKLVRFLEGRVPTSGLFACLHEERP